MCIRLSIRNNTKIKVGLNFLNCIIESIFNGYFLNTAYHKNGDYHTRHENILVSIHTGSLIKDNKKNVLFNNLILTKKLYMYIVTNVPTTWIINKKLNAMIE